MDPVHYIALSTQKKFNSLVEQVGSLKGRIAKILKKKNTLFPIASSRHNHRYLESPDLKDRTCVIEIIAATKEKGLTKQVYEFVKGKFTAGRGEHVFTGHTAIYIKRGDIEIATGFMPRLNGVVDKLKFICVVYGGYLLGKPSIAVPGEWSENEDELLKDKEVKRFGISVTEKLAKEFESFISNIKKLDHDYSLMPGSEKKVPVIYLANGLDDINPRKIKQKAIVLIKDEGNTYKAHYIQNKRWVLDEEGAVASMPISLHEAEKAALAHGRPGKSIHRHVNNSMLLNTIIDSALSKTDLEWREDNPTRNCVSSAVNVFIDFFYEYKDKIDEEGEPYFSELERGEIDQMLDDIVKATSERPHCGQSSLTHNIAAWKKNRAARRHERRAKNNLEAA